MSNRIKTSSVTATNIIGVIQAIETHLNELERSEKYIEQEALKNMLSHLGVEFQEK